MLNHRDYNHWLSVARRHMRRCDEAEDLLHESLLAAVQARRTDLADPQSSAWFAGILRNKARFAARTAGRRRRREAQVAAPGEQAIPAPAAPGPADAGTLDIIRSLPRSARIVAILALHGLTREEIASVLDLSPEAFRQRLRTLRKRCQGLREEDREHALVIARQRRRTLGHEFEVGLIRRALVAWLHEVSGIGTHDPDGHLIIVSRGSSRSGGPRQQRGSPTQEA